MNDPTKPYQLTFEEREHYLCAHIKADSTDHETAVDYWRKIVEKCRRLECERLMVVQEIPGGLNTTETFNVASDVTAMGIHDIKIAFVDPDTTLYESHQFGQLVGTNRGAWSEVFTTIPEAENWLLMGLGSSLPSRRLNDVD
jgi:hypothetical protein